VIEVAWTGGDDPDLDGLLVLFEVCTGARREGILKLRTDGLDVVGLQVDLWEKFNSTRWQPVMKHLLGMLIEHVLERHLVIVDPGRWSGVTADDVLDGRVRLPSGIPVFHHRPKPGPDVEGVEPPAGRGVPRRGRWPRRGGCRGVGTVR